MRKTALFEIFRKLALEMCGELELFEFMSLLCWRYGFDNGMVQNFT